MAIFCSLFCSIGKGNADSDLLELEDSGFALFLDVADSRATFITSYKCCAQRNQVFTAHQISLTVKMTLAMSLKGDGEEEDNVTEIYSVSHTGSNRYDNVMCS